MEYGTCLLFLVSVVTASTSYEYLPRTVSRYDKTKTRDGTACENYNDYETYRKFEKNIENF